MSQLLRSALAVVCPACDAYNPPKTQQCAACGAAIEAPSGESARGSPEAAAAPQASPSATTPARTPARPERVGRSEAVPPGLKPSARTPAPMIGVAPAPVPAITPPAKVAPVTVPAAPTRRPTPPQTPSTAPAPTIAPVIPPATRPAAAAPPIAPVIPAAPPVTASPQTTTQPMPLTQPARPPARAGTEGAAAGRAPSTSRFAVVVHGPSGQTARYRLPNGATLIGRNRGGLIFPDDPFVSPQHAALLIRDGTLYIRDEGSASGVYVAISGQEAIEPGAMFCAGNRLFRYVGPLHPPAPATQIVPYGAPIPTGQAIYALEEVMVGNRAGRAITTVGPLVTIGAQGCDLTFPNEPGLAARHIELTPTPVHAVLRDLSGGLGTYVRAPAQVDRPLVPGDRIRVGQELIQIEVG